MQITKAIINNWRGLCHHELIPEGSPVFLCGENGAGKTSACQALQIALSGNAVASKAAKLSTHRGAATGYHVQIDVGGDSVTATAAGVVCSSGKHDDAVACGNARLSRLKPKERLAHYITLCGVRALDGAVAYFNAMPGGGAVREDFMKRATANAVNGDLRDWDAFGADYEEALRAGKRRFTAITGDPYGSVKSANWRPAGLPLTETRSIDELEAALASAKDSYLRSAGRHEALRQEVDKHKETIENLQSEIDSEGEFMIDNHEIGDDQDAGLEFEGGNPLLESIDKINQTHLAAAEAELNRLRESQQRVKLVCPQCETDLVLSARDKTKLVIALSEMNPERLQPQIDKQRQKVDDLRSWIAAYTKIKQLTAQQAQWQSRIDAINVELQQDVVTGTATENTDTLQLYITETRRMNEVATVLEECRRMTLLKDACAPTGIRKIAADSSLQQLNGMLQSIAEDLDFPIDIQLLADGDVTIQRDKYATLLDYASESECWMTDLCYQAVAASLTGARCMVVDKVDILSEAQAKASFDAMTQLNGGNIILAATGTVRWWEAQSTEPDNVEFISLSE